MPRLAHQRTYSEERGPRSSVRFAWKVSPNHLLIGIGMAFSVVLLAGVSGSIWYLRGEAIADTDRAASNLSFVLAEQSATTLRSVEDLIFDAIAALRTSGHTDDPNPLSAKAVHDFLKERASALPPALSVFVIGRTGATLHSSRSFPPPPFNASDRSYFIAQRDNPKAGLFISEPRRNRADPEKWSFFLSRAITSAGGDLEAVVVASVDLDYFESIYRALRLPTGTSIALLHRNGVALALHPHDDQIIGEVFSSPELAARAMSFGAVSDIGGGPSTRVAHDPEIHIVKSRDLGPYPLRVSIAVPTNNALALWRLKAYQIGFAGGFIALVIGILLLLLARQIKCREQKEKLISGMLAIAPDAIISTDENHNIRVFNKSAERIFGYDADEVIGRSISMLIPESSRDIHKKHLESFTGRNAESRLMGERSEVRGLRKNGQAFPAAASISRLDLGDHTIFTAMLHDITLKKEQEEAIQAAKERAESANRAKSEFLASMSHELRTPLNAIIGFAEITVGQVLGPVGNVKYLEYAEDIHNAGTHLLGLINNILDLSKVESGLDELHEEALDVAGIVDAVRKFVQERADTSGVKLVADVPDDLPRLHADERKLKQILVNLLSNAVKFTPAGGSVTIGVWCRTDGDCVFQVTDTGIGIAPDDIPKALSRFGQVDSSLSRKYEGTGLGLPLTKALVELHGGSLELRSEVDIGTTVTVRFPAERVGRRSDNTRTAHAV